MKQIFKLASQLCGYYSTLYRETQPFHNSQMTNQEKAFGIIDKIKEEVKKETENGQE